MDSKLFLLLTVFALSVATFSQATPTNHQHTSTDIFYDAFMEIRDVSHAIREIFENFVSFFYLKQAEIRKCYEYN